MGPAPGSILDARRTALNGVTEGEEKNKAFVHLPRPAGKGSGFFIRELTLAATFTFIALHGRDALNLVRERAPSCASRMHREG